MGEITAFKLSGAESFAAKLFRSHHKRQGCKVRGILGVTHREVQEIEPTYSYIFEQISSDRFRKYIKCNNCKEQTEITEKKDK